jgi:hypothetical protein
MPSFLRDVFVRNVVLNDEEINELHAVFLGRLTAHNQAMMDDDHRLIPIYVVRFDGRGYRTFSADEAWNFYKGADSVERVVLQAESPLGMRTNHLVGGQIEIRLDADRKGSSHIVVGGESKDWVEATFSALEAVLNRRRNLATAIIRTPWTALVLQLLGVLVGVLLALWLATLSGPLLKGVDYPRAVSFAFWFLVYSNLWTYLQQRALDGIDALFPNVRFSRSGDHWTHTLLRKALEAAGVAIFLWAFAWLTRWATSVIAPLLAGNS